MKILLVYPNSGGIRRIPLGISILSACLKKAGYNVDLFDTTFYKRDDEDNIQREKMNIVIPVDLSKIYKKHNNGDYKRDFIQKIKTNKPNIIAFSLLQDNYNLTKELLQDIKKHTNAFILIGGVMPTVVPEFVLNTLSPDAVMIGEGERSILELCRNIEDNKDVFLSSNLCYYKNNSMVYNPISQPIPLTELPFHDYELFDEEHLWRPFIGRVWKTGYFELTRGCPYSCTFCSNSSINRRYGKKGRIRSRTVDQLINEIEFYKHKYKLELISFCDENFLQTDQIGEFVSKWLKKVNLPFMIQTRIESIKEEKIKLLKIAGCLTISIGIESGDQQFRKNTLNRHYSNDSIIEAFSICRKIGIRTTANNIIGFPGETEEQIIETIKINRKAKPDSISVCTFVPYKGTELYEKCLFEGFIDEEVPNKDLPMYDSVLKFPQIHNEMIKYYIDNFNIFVFSEDKIRPF